MDLKLAGGLYKNIEAKLHKNDDEFLKERVVELRTKNPGDFNMNTDAIKNMVKEISNKLETKYKGSDKNYYSYVRIHTQIGAVQFKISNGEMEGFDDDYYRNNQGGSGSGIGKIEVFSQIA